MNHSKKLFASVTVLALGLALGFGLAQLGSAEAGPTSQEVSQTAMRETAADDLPDMVPQGIFVRVAEQVTPAVVYIQAEHQVRGQTQGIPEFFRRFFEDEGGLMPEDHPEFGDIQRSQGSGFLISSDGYIVTNAHVVSTYETNPPEVFKAESVTVTLANQDEYAAEIVGVDPLGTDIAVLKIEASGLPHLSWGNSESARVGEWVMALGAPFGLTETVSAGIISAKGRSIPQLATQVYQDYIQTDAAINPGNSGGPLVNLRGQIIGVNTLIVTNGFDQRFAGVGFATPVDLVTKVTEQIIANGRVVRGWLGVGIRPLDDPEMAEAFGMSPREARNAVVLSTVNAGGPANQAGLEPYDVVVAMNGKELEGNQDFLQRIALTPPGETVTLTVLRDGEEIERDVTLAQRPPEIDVFADTRLGGEQAPSRRGRTPDDRTGRTDAARELGLQVQELTPRLAREFGYEGAEGVLITGVTPNSPAFQKGLRRGMLILDVDREPVRSVAGLQDRLATVAPGEVVLFRLQTPQGNVLVSVRMPEN